MTVGLLDYGVGNLHSLGKAIEAAGARVDVTSDWDRAIGNDALVLPGVGAFAAAARSLPADRGTVRAALAGGLPCLGICLGMQILFDRSEEGDGSGLGVIPGTVRRLRTKVTPQMGWNDVATTEDPLFAGDEPLVAYYANSYVCEPADPGAAIAWSTHEGERFVAAVRSGTTWGVQFHPEKSSAGGLRLIANFLDLAGKARRRAS